MTNCIVPDQRRPRQRRAASSQHFEPADPQLAVLDPQVAVPPFRIHSEVFERSASIVALLTSHRSARGRAR
jgi:hypothetical protein